METTIAKNTLAKKQSGIFGKKKYLLGQDAEGVDYWLRSPSWDCDWYWGFGYVSTKDSHQHIDSSFMGEQYDYDFSIKGYKKGKYIHNLYDCPTFDKTTFDENTGWILSELFKEFYLLKDMAELYHKGGAGLTTSPLHDLLKNPEQEKHINKILIPAITAKIIELLKP